MTTDTGKAQTEDICIVFQSSVVQFFELQVE